MGSTPNFGWFDNNSSTFQNWSGSEPDLNSGSDAVGAILGFLNTAVWIDELQIQTGNGIYKRLKTTTTRQYSNTLSTQYIPLSGDLGPGKYLLITRLDRTDQFPTPGDNFTGAFASPELAPDVVHYQFNYSKERMSNITLMHLLEMKQ